MISNQIFTESAKGDAIRDCFFFGSVAGIVEVMVKNRFDAK